MRHSAEFYIAVTEAFLPATEAGVRNAATRAAVVDAATFARDQVDALASPLRALLYVGLGGFRVAVRLRHLRGFCDLPLERRRQILMTWALGSMALTRQMFRPIRATALLAYYEHRAART